MSRKSKLGWIAVILGSVLGVGIGLNYVVHGAIEVSKVQNNEYEDSDKIQDKDTIIEENHYVNTVNTVFVTNAVFAVKNHIDGSITVSVKEPQNTAQVVATVISKKSKTPWSNLDSSTIMKNLNIIKQTSPETFGWSTVPQGQDYTIGLSIDPSSQESTVIIVFIQKTDDSWHYVGSYDLPIIEPYASILQLKSNRIMEGLTWVFVGFIPIGLIAEFWIVYLTERHFYLIIEKTNDKIKPHSKWHMPFYD